MLNVLPSLMTSYHLYRRSSGLFLFGFTFSLRLHGYPFMRPLISTVLSVLPVLEVLTILCTQEDEEEVVLEHARTFEVVIGDCKVGLFHYIIVNVNDVTFTMPNPVRVDVKKSSVRVLKVA